MPVYRVLKKFNFGNSGLLAGVSRAGSFVCSFLSRLIDLSVMSGNVYYFGSSSESSAFYDSSANKSANLSFGALYPGDFYELPEMLLPLDFSDAN